MAEIIDETCHGCPGALLCATDTAVEVVFCVECERVWLRIEETDPTTKFCTKRFMMDSRVRQVQYNFATVNEISAETSIYVVNDCPKIPPDLGGPEGYDRGDVQVLCPECFADNMEDLGSASEHDENKYNGDWDDEDIEL